jgi:hypothetical protein
MKAKISRYVFLTSLFLFISCYSNLMYFDIETQSLVGCDYAISSFDIVKENGFGHYQFKTIEEKSGRKHRKERKRINIKKLNEIFYISGYSTWLELNELNEIYYIDDEGKGYVDKQKFRLYPESEYTITNYTNGDAGGCKVRIKTDKDGNVIYSDKTSCPR